MIQRGDFERGAGTRRSRDPREDYFGAITAQGGLARRLRVVVDAGNGIAGQLRPRAAPPARAPR